MKQRCFARTACGLVLVVACTSPATAEKIFGTVWQDRYGNGDPSTEAEETWAKSVKKAKCYVCHVKGKSKKYCNRYGDALAEWLDSDNYERERLEAEQEQVKAEIQAALERAESRQDACGLSFQELFQSYRLPSADLGEKSAERAKASAGQDEEEETDDEEDE